ncbi:MAG TPA: SRPBCC family protein [Pseudonocardiaceae bacterium]|nr:SRPBCC family protein [Pseudonocardiaceae bacterium]
MRYAECPTTDVESYIDARPERVWELVTDIRLIAEVSTELTRVEWQDEAGCAAVGARFVGHNFHQAMGEWQTTSFVIECERPRVFAWAVSDVANPSSIWRFTLRPDGTGTVLTQWAQMGPGRSGLNYAIDAMPDKEERIVARRLSEFRTGMTANLARIKELSEAPVA